LRVVVLGGGSSGEHFVGALRRLDDSAELTLVECGLVGGECSYWACMPTKTMLRATELVAETRRAPGITPATLEVAGVFGWRTLSQGHKFKQHDVEARCIKDYLEIEQQLTKARTNDELISAVREDWVLMLYEFYWWRQNLLSRELFTNWCEFRRQRFAKNEAYLDKGGTPLEFTNYISGYNHFRTEKVFPRDSRFDYLMRYLISRRKSKKPVTWYEIEHFRHGWGRPI